MTLQALFEDLTVDAEVQIDAPPVAVWGLVSRWSPKASRSSCRFAWPEAASAGKRFGEPSAQRVAALAAARSRPPEYADTLDRSGGWR
jgi:hypothetical protein